MAATKKKDDRLWYTRVEAAALCSMEPRNFDERVRPLVAAESVRGTGAKLRYQTAGVATALVAYRTKPAKPATDDEADPLLTDVDSPALERYRGHRADLAEMEVRERRGELVRVAVVKAGMAAGIAAFRKTGEMITRLFGNEAGAMFNEGLAAFVAAAQRVIGRTDADGDADRKQ